MTIRKINVFKVGEQTSSTGNTREFTSNELNEIVENYNPNIHEAPIVLGHSGDNDSHPSYGWIKKFKKEGNQLYAIVDTTKPLDQLIKDKHYKKVSISLYSPKSKVNPFPGKWSARHLAFLGASPPAIKGLEDFAYSEEDEGIFSYKAFEMDLDEEFAPTMDEDESPLELMKQAQEEFLAEKDKKEKKIMNQVDPIEETQEEEEVIESTEKKPAMPTHYMMGGKHRPLDEMNLYEEDDEGEYVRVSKGDFSSDKKYYYKEDGEYRIYSRSKLFTEDSEKGFIPTFSETDGKGCPEGEKMVFGVCRKVGGSSKGDKDFDTSKKSSMEEKLEKVAAANKSAFENNKPVIVDGKKYGWAKKGGKPILVAWGSVAGERKKAENKKNQNSKSKSKSKSKSEVKELQEKLKKAGFDIDVDGIMGEETKKALSLAKKSKDVSFGEILDLDTESYVEHIFINENFDMTEYNQLEYSYDGKKYPMYYKEGRRYYPMEMGENYSGNQYYKKGGKYVMIESGEDYKEKKHMEYACEGKKYKMYYKEKDEYYPMTEGEDYAGMKKYYKKGDEYHMAEDYAEAKFKQKGKNAMKMGDNEETEEKHSGKSSEMEEKRHSTGIDSDEDNRKSVGKTDVVEDGRADQGKAPEIKGFSTQEKGADGEQDEMRKKTAKSPDQRRPIEDSIADKETKSIPEKIDIGKDDENDKIPEKGHTGSIKSKKVKVLRYNEELGCNEEIIGDFIEEFYENSLASEMSGLSRHENVIESMTKDDHIKALKDEIQNMKNDLLALREDNVKLKNAAKMAMKEARHKEITDFITGLYQSGKLVDAVSTPHDLISYCEMLGDVDEGEVLEFSEDEPKLLDRFKSMLENLQPIVSFGEMEEANLLVEPEEELDFHEKALKISEEKGVKYEDAIKEVLFG